MASAGEPAEHEQRTEALLRAMVGARRAGDAARRQETMVELLSIFDVWLRPLAAARLFGSGVSAEAADDVVNRTLKRVADMLERKLSFDKALWKVVLDNLDWEVKDYWRRHGRAEERPEDPAGLEIADPKSELGHHQVSMVDEAIELRRQLDGSSDEDIRLLGLRLFHGLDPQAIAERIGKSRGAVDTALSRALQRVRQRRQRVTCKRFEREDG